MREQRSARMSLKVSFDIGPLWGRKPKVRRYCSFTIQRIREGRGNKNETRRILRWPVFQTYWDSRPWCCRKCRALSEKFAKPEREKKGPTVNHCCKKISQGCEERGELTCLQTKLQVVLGDDEYGHGFDKKEESKGNAERTLASLLQLEIVGRQGKKCLAVGGEVKETHPQKKPAQKHCAGVKASECVSEIKPMQNIWNALTNSHSPHKEHYLDVTDHDECSAY